MRVLASPEFLEKVRPLASDPHFQRAMAEIASIFSASGTRAELLARSADVAALRDDVFTIRRDDVRAFFSLASDASGEYVMLLDLAAKRAGDAGRAFAAHDPRVNSAVNPLINSTINPRVNGSLNPAFNGAINPNFNGAISPRFNGAINPSFNGAVNYRFNGAINPQFNGSLNPKFNSTLSPRFNPLHGGPFVYLLSLDREAYLVRANDDVRLLFGMDDQFRGVAVSNKKGGFNLFDLNNEWVAYLVPHSQDGFLRFGLDATWTGFVV